MTLNFHHIKGAMGNATLLAGPGALFGTFATAGMANWLFGYGWSWHLCFLFGSILCATDPVGEYPPPSPCPPHVADLLQLWLLC